MATDKTTRLLFSFINMDLLIWIFCSNHSIGKINSAHERCLSLMQQNYASDF